MRQPRGASDGIASRVSPDEPAVIRRLPPGVEYTHVKMIIHSLPSGLTTMTWAAEVDDPIWAAFRGKPYRRLDMPNTARPPKPTGST